MSESAKAAVLEQCRKELAMNFECPSDRILRVYGEKLGLTGPQMYALLTDAI